MKLRGSALVARSGHGGRRWLRARRCRPAIRRTVTVAGIEPLQGQGLEMRMLVKLRVQNPNDSQIDYNGVSLKLDVQDKTLASGVSDQAGTVPRFGEAVIEVPVTISAMNIARQVMGAMGGKPIEKVDYVHERQAERLAVQHGALQVGRHPGPAQDHAGGRRRDGNEESMTYAIRRRHVPPRASQRVIRRTEIQGRLVDAKAVLA